MSKQYVFRDGKFVDDWNAGIDDESPIPEYLSEFEDSWAEIILGDLIGLCGCQDAKPLMPLFYAYMTGEWGRYEDTIIQFNWDDPTHVLVASICCDRDLTEHGGNIGGSWLRPEGERWLELYRRISRDSETPATSDPLRSG
jgi:hypothetical protein